VTRIGVFGWGLVAPGASNISVFAERLDEGSCWLSPFEGFGPSNFLVGDPDFDFADYKAWIDARFPPSRFPALRKKFGGPTQYAVGAFVQALEQNPEVEAELKALGLQAQCIVGAGLHDIPTYNQISRDLHHAQRRWNRFWADPQNNAALRAHLSGERPAEDPPPAPEEVDVREREEAEEAYWAFWSARSPELGQYLTALRKIEGMKLEGNLEGAGATLIKKKRAATVALRKEWGAPEPPWETVPATALWNIGNTPASQISMLGKVTGPCFSPFAACSAFGFALRLGMDAIRHGDAKLAVVGASEPAPHPLSVGTFYDARVLANDGRCSEPLTDLRGTHVAGGSCIWIIGDLDHYRAKGWRALGMEPLAVGLSADADHIITPSIPGPSAAIKTALDAAGVDAQEVTHWDLHATGTPGDALEVHTARMHLGEHARFTARKGTFGHGMGAGGGWELTAQYLGFSRGRIYRTPLEPDRLNPEIRKEHDNFVFDQECPADGEIAGKLSMGVGGVNACVISRRLR
jgi:3-oxoacyl-(acyl-carrier-protein) synthase